MSSTYFPCEGEIKQEWWLADADGRVLGRLATTVAAILRGKTKPIYTPFLDTGDFVVVVNAAKIRLTGKKLEQKIYYHHSGYPGGIKSITAGDRLEKDPAGMVRDAIVGMLPHNRLGRQMARKLKVCAGPEHPHAAQRPRPLTLNERGAPITAAAPAAADATGDAR